MILKMKLYHYSTEKHKKLLTLEIQNKVSAQWLEDEDNARMFRFENYRYSQHVSFFFEPIPADVLGSIYPENHKAWRTGNTLYEHIVDTDDIHLMEYRVVESPWRNLFYDFVPWLDNSFYKRMYFKVRNGWSLLAGEIGVTHDALHKATRKHIGHLKEEFVNAGNRDDFDDFSHQYAALVTHVMVYTDKAIPVKSIKKITIKNLKDGLESQFKYLDW